LLRVYGISKRQLALRAGLCYTHVLRVLSAKVTPRLETMMLLDEALEQLMEDMEEQND
jgi:predicted transcriptional regulator